MLRRRAAIIAGLAVAVAVLHAFTPVGPHEWHWVHLIARKLFYVPILMAAAWFPIRWAIATAAVLSVLFLAHVVVDWEGRKMLQAEQTAEIATYWTIAGLGCLLFERQRRALVDVQKAHKETLAALSGSLELRERYTAGHSERVRDYTLLLASRLSITDTTELATLAAGAQFHDVGKIGIPDRILLKNEKLDPAEWEVMKRHPELGSLLVGRIPFLREASDLIWCHHERYDGKGYPRQLVGERIPRGARIFAIADAFDAMTTNRPYRPSMTFEVSRQAIAAAAGSQFDPAIVEAFLAIPKESWNAVAMKNGITLDGKVATAGRL
jgi:HD-GYP domain-containing protein (c-di-GMP phosphodiesterase class II)